MSIFDLSHTIKPVRVDVEYANDFIGKYKKPYMYLTRKYKDEVFADKIRNDFKLLALGECHTQKKKISLYFNSSENKIYGVSHTYPDRWFEVSEAI